MIQLNKEEKEAIYMVTTKPTFAKLKLQNNIEKKVITFNDFEIEVKQYLPIQEKLKLISNVLNSSSTEQNYSNPVQEDVFGTLEIIYAYTNIAFTEKQKEDPANLYDIIVSSGLADAVIAAIPEVEYKTIVDGINRSIEAIYAYRNSIYGILDSVSQDYGTLDMDASEIQKKLTDPNNLELFSFPI